jgi:uncharacterized protein (UPF0333 family)
VIWMIKKGQITMESLLLYGLAILVVLLAIGALTFFGVLDLGRALPDRCTLTGSGALECLEWSVSKEGDGTRSNITLGIRNSGTTEVQVSKGSIDIQGASGVFCNFTQVGNNGRISAGSQHALVFVCQDSDGTPYNFTQNIGQKIRGNMELTYAGAIVTTHKASGSLVATLTS